MTAKDLITELILAAYDSGYFSGRGEAWKPCHVAAIKRRNELRDELLRRLDKKEKA